MVAAGNAMSGRWLSAKPVPSLLAVLCGEAAAPHEIRRHEGDRRRVRGAAGVGARLSNLTPSEMGTDVLLAFSPESGAEVESQLVLAEVLACRRSC